MDRCIAVKKNGEACTNRVAIGYVRNYCRVHHNSKMSTDEEYRIAFNRYIADAERRRQEALAEEMANQRRQAEARAASRRERNARLVEESPNFSTMRILKYATRLIHIWSEQSIPTYDCAKAYAAIVYRSPRHEGFTNLIKAIISIINLTTHPIHTNFRAIPEDERNVEYRKLHAALEPYGEIDPVSVIPTSDKYRELLVQRIAREEAARQAARVAAEAAARRAAFEQADRERPVVFQRDPEGSIDLRAFAADPQSVHRSSVQNTTHRIIQQILARPVPEDQETIFEITVDLFNPDIVSWRNENFKLTTINMFTDEYFNLEAFSVKYGDVVDRVWAFIRGHAERVELVIRLAQEISEGTGMCANGKMARLVNVLQGYDETLDVEPPREIFQSAIAALMNRPLAEREARARELFTEYQIPAEEHNAWLEPLLEV